MSLLAKASAALVLAGLFAATPAMSETQTETIVSEQRVSVSLRVKPEVVQGFLPAGWTSSAAAGAPNMTIIWMDRALQLTPDGKPLFSGLNRNLVVAVAARNAAGERRSMIVGGYSADPQYVPGAYKVNRPGSVSVTRAERKETRDGKLTTEVEEHWAAKGADGATVTMDIVYTRGLPTFTTFEQKNYSGADPDFYRIYRGQQASETLRGPAVDHVKSIRLKASGGALGKAIDGTEQIVGVSAAPFYSRKTYLP